MWTLWQLLIGPTLVLGADFNTSVWLDVSGLSLIGQPTPYWILVQRKHWPSRQDVLRPVDLAQLHLCRNGI